MLIEKTMQGFLDELASNSPAPGGGSVAALGGALSACLLSMVSNVTIGKKKYVEVEEDMKKHLAVAEDWRRRMALSVDEDMAAFNELMSAYKMDKNSPEDEVKRTNVIQEALMQAINIPLEVANGCLELLKLAIKIADKGNVRAISDAGVAVLMAETALQGALLNVKINLSSVDSENTKEELSGLVAELATEGAKTKRKALEIVESKL